MDIHTQNYETRDLSLILYKNQLKMIRYLGVRLATQTMLEENISEALEAICMGKDFQNIENLGSIGNNSKKQLRGLH